MTIRLTEDSPIRQISEFVDSMNGKFGEPITEYDDAHFMFMR